jgi:hypothetical protein
MQTYAHVLPEVQKQTASKMDEILQTQPKQPQRRAKNGVATSVATKAVSALVS